MSEHVLVTGGLGYLGSVLCEHLLDAGYQVTALDNLMYGVGQQGLFHLCAHPAFEFVQGDVRDEALMQAALPPRRCGRPPGRHRRRRGLRPRSRPGHERQPRRGPPAQPAAQPAPARRSIRTPTAATARPPATCYCTEESPLQPISLYGQTKVEAEQVLLDSPNAIALRLATVFGMSPRMRLDLLVNHFVHAAVTEGYLVIFEKDFKRNFVHIRDVADCMLHCIAHAEQMAGRPYNVGLDCGQPVQGGTGARRSRNTCPDFYIHFAADRHRTRTSGTTSSPASGCAGPASRPSGRWTTASRNCSRATA